MNVPFLAALTLDGVLSAIQMIIAHVVGGSYTPAGASAATTITFADSWVGMFLDTITSTNGLLLISFILSICLFGLHVLKSLMNR